MTDNYYFFGFGWVDFQVVFCQPGLDIIKFFEWLCESSMSQSADKYHMAYLDMRFLWCFGWRSGAAITSDGGPTTEPWIIDALIVATLEMVSPIFMLLITCNYFLSFDGDCSFRRR